MTCSVCGSESSERICVRCGCPVSSVRGLRIAAVIILIVVVGIAVAVPTVAIPRYIARSEEIEQKLAEGKKTVEADLAVFFEQISAPNKPSKFVTLAERYEKNLRLVLNLRGLGAAHPRVRSTSEQFDEYLQAVQDLYLAVKNDVRKADGTTSGLSILQQRSTLLQVPEIVRDNYESIILQLRDRAREIDEARVRLEFLEQYHARLYSTMQLLISKAAIAADAKEPSAAQLRDISAVAYSFDDIWESTSDPDVERAARLGRDWAEACAEYYDIYGQINEYLRRSWNPDQAAVRELRSRYLGPLSRAANAFREQLKTIEGKIKGLRSQADGDPRNEVITPMSMREM